MSEVRKDPRLRFKNEFGLDFPDWTSKPFSDIYDFLSTNSFSRDKLNYVGGMVKNIHYGDIHTKFRTQFKVQNELVPFINPEVDLQKLKTTSFVKNGDLVIADASEDYGDIGKTIEIIDNNGEKIVCGLHTIHARKSSDEIIVGFSSFLMNSRIVRKSIMMISQGTKVLGLSSKRLGEINLIFPSQTEQKKISEFLTSVGQRIELLEKKKSLLETYKKGVIKKIFNQEIRFKDDNGNDFPDWDNFKLNQVLFEHKKKNTKSKFDEVFSVSKHKGVVNQIEHLGRSYSSETIDHYKLINDWDIVYTKSPTSDFPFGIIKQNTTGRTGVLSPLYGVFRPKNKWVGKMIASYFESWINTYNYLNPLVQKGAKNTMNINNETFLNGKLISLPTSEEEQEKISRFLFSIENQIELFETQIEKSKTWKKGLLQKMFV